jgi:hypothetical protein
MAQNIFRQVTSGDRKPFPDPLLRDLWHRFIRSAVFPAFFSPVGTEGVDI